MSTTDENNYAGKILPAKPTINLEQYKKLHKESIENPEEFWGKAAKEHVDWFRSFDSVVEGGFEHGDVRWFEGGKLNLSYNALDCHIKSPKANDLASGEVFSCYIHQVLV